MVYSLYHPFMVMGMVYVWVYHTKRRSDAKTNSSWLPIALDAGRGEPWPRVKVMARQPCDMAVSADVMWVKHCHKPPITGNGLYHLYELWFGGWFLIVLSTWYSKWHMFDWENYMKNQWVPEVPYFQKNKLMLQQKGKGKMWTPDRKPGSALNLLYLLMVRPRKLVVFQTN